MIYDGVLSRLLSIDLDEMRRALRKQLGKKAKALALNEGALDAGFRFAAESLEKRTLSARSGWTHGREDPHRRQCGRRARLHDGRRDRRRLVPDHPVVLALRDPD